MKDFLCILSVVILMGLMFIPLYLDGVEEEKAIAKGQAWVAEQKGEKIEKDNSAWGLVILVPVLVVMFGFASGGNDLSWRKYKNISPKMALELFMNERLKR